MLLSDLETPTSTCQDDLLDGMKTIAKVLGDKEEDDVKRNEDIKEETKGRPKR